MQIHPKWITTPSEICSFYAAGLPCCSALLFSSCNPTGSHATRRCIVLRGKSITLTKENDWKMQPEEIGRNVAFPWATFQTFYGNEDAKMFIRVLRYSQDFSQLLLFKLLNSWILTAVFVKNEQNVKFISFGVFKSFRKLFLCWRFVRGLYSKKVCWTNGF